MIDREDIFTIMFTVFIIFFTSFGFYASIYVFINSIRLNLGWAIFISSIMLLSMVFFVVFISVEIIRELKEMIKNERFQKL